MNKTFTAELKNKYERLDYKWFNPVFKNLFNRVESEESWKTIKLKEIADISGGKRLPKGTIITDNNNNKIPYVKGENINKLKVNIKSAQKIPEDIYKKIQDYQLKKGDIAITIVGTIGKVGILDKEIRPCNFNENIAKIRIKNDKVVNRYVLYFLDSKLGKMQTNRFSAGSLQEKLSLESCRNIKIILPEKNGEIDVDLQKEIVNKAQFFLKKARGKQNEYNKVLSAIDSKIEQFIQAPSLKSKSEKQSFVKKLPKEKVNRIDVLFNHPYRDYLLNFLKKFPHEKLGNLTEIKTKRDIPVKDFHKVVDLKNIDEKTGKIKSYVEKSTKGSSKYLFETNDLLVSRLQPDKGKIAIVNDKYGGCIGSTELLPLVLKSDKVTLDYLWVILRSKYVLDQWKYELTGSSRMRLSRKELRETIVPIIEKKEQMKMVTKINREISKAETNLKQAKDYRKQARKLFLETIPHPDFQN